MLIDYLVSLSQLYIWTPPDHYSLPLNWREKKKDTGVGEHKSLETLFFFNRNLLLIIPIGQHKLFLLWNGWHQEFRILPLPGESCKRELQVTCHVECTVEYTWRQQGARVAIGDGPPCPLQWGRVHSVSCWCSCWFTMRPQARLETKIRLRLQLVLSLC
jgi:hypothetical protein